jgi:hypothetical protein
MGGEIVRVGCDLFGFWRHSTKKKKKKIKSKQSSNIYLKNQCIPTHPPQRLIIEHWGGGLLDWFAQ